MALQLADYFKVIKEPMDLGTVRTRLAGGFYQGAEEMADAVHLTFSNAMMYNPKGSVAHEDAKKCLTVFEKKWEAVARKVRPPVAMPTPGHAATPRRPPTLPCTRLRARPLPPHLRASAPPRLRTRPSPQLTAGEAAGGRPPATLPPLASFLACFVAPSPTLTLTLTLTPAPHPALTPTLTLTPVRRLRVASLQQTEQRLPLLQPTRRRRRRRRRRRPLRCRPPSRQARAPSTHNAGVACGVPTLTPTPATLQA